MIVVNKKFKVITITLLILLEIASTYLMYRSFNNRNVVLDNVKLKSNNKNNGLAIMIEQEDGTYKESSSNTWPEEMMYNEEKSGCIDSNGKKIENALIYESGIATVNTNTTSYCYLYFDLIKDDVTIVISTDGESGAMPSNGAYTNSATCTSGNITWNDKYKRIEIGDLGTSSSKCNLAFTKDNNTKILLKTEVENKTTTNANGYRYSGKQPNNWIWFNNEMWRIIGSIPTCLSANCGTNTTNLVKIIRDESIGGLVYDSIPSGETLIWGTNRLYKLLNNYYYGALDGTKSDYCYSSAASRGNCDYRGEGINLDNNYGKMIKNVYWNTGVSSLSATASASYASEKSSSIQDGYVGLMSVSDYGYAADSSYHETSLGSSYSGTSTLWLYGSGMEWTNTAMSNNNMVLYITANGYVYGAGQSGTYTVRPVVYLDSSVYIISGSGSITDPYIIGM